MILTFDRWVGATERGESIAQPGEVEIAAAIYRLDGTSFTLVTLAFTETRHLAIGGGPDVCFLYQTDDNQAFWRADAGEEKTGNMRLCVGGQPGDYATRNLVTKERALQVALHYARTGARMPSVRWVLP